MRVPIQGIGRNLGRGDFHQRAIAKRPVEAIPPPGVTGDAILMHQQQQRVAVAIDPQFLQVLRLAGRFAFPPQPAATAGTRPLASKRIASRTGEMAFSFMNGI
jgi:hypothetical protein